MDMSAMCSYLLLFISLLEVRTCLGDPTVCVVSRAVLTNRSMTTHQNDSNVSLQCDVTFNGDWTHLQFGPDVNTIPAWFFIVMAAFQCGLLLVFAGCLLVAWKYVTVQHKKEHVADFVPGVPTGTQSNNYTPETDGHLQAPGIDQAYEVPCATISDTRRDQETYDRVPVRVGSTNKQRQDETNTDPGLSVTDGEDRYDFPTMVVRRV